MKLHVRYTAQLRAAMGLDEEEVDLPEGANLEALLAHLASKHADAASHLVTDAGQVRPSLLVVVNDAAAAPADAADTELQPGDVVTLLPPIAGG
jgi:sulfur-carrier protein